MSLFVGIDFVVWFDVYGIDMFVVIGYMMYNCNVLMVYYVVYVGLKVEYLNDVMGVLFYENEVGVVSVEEIYCMYVVVF